MKIYTDQAGQLLRVIWHDSQNQIDGWTPPAGLQSLEVDDAGNPGLLEAVLADMDAYRFDGGTLYRDGQPVPVNAPTLAYSERQQALALARYIKSYDRTKSTTARDRAQLEALSRAVLILGRLALRELEGE